VAALAASEQTDTANNIAAVTASEQKDTWFQNKTACP
jgi:hypothetical protein